MIPFAGAAVVAVAYFYAMFLLFPWLFTLVRGAFENHDVGLIAAIVVTILVAGPLWVIGATVILIVYASLKGYFEN